MTFAKTFLILIAGAAGGILVMPTALPAQAAPTSSPDPIRGGQLFLQCRACHTAAAGGAQGIGPNLAGIVGAQAASRPGYPYSPALTKSGLVWTAATLDGFLTRPSQMVPGTKMAFAGVADAKARAAIIAYLTTLKAEQ